MVFRATIAGLALLALAPNAFAEHPSKPPVIASPATPAFEVRYTEMDVSVDDVSVVSAPVAQQGRIAFDAIVCNIGGVRGLVRVSNFAATTGFATSASAPFSVDPNMCAVVWNAAGLVLTRVSAPNGQNWRANVAIRERR